MLELKVFQTESAALIANRYAFFANHPNRPRKGSTPRPFFQALSALTGAGKTPILAEAVSTMRGHFSAEPMVFWISRAKSVVAQTYTNFSSGGKYCEILDGFRVIGIGSLTPTLISDSSAPLMVLATVGLFNNKDQSEGALNIYKQDNDQFGDRSPWERLIERKNSEGVRRPLIVVYDEGHNLSPQQAEILAELEPDAYLLASATLTLPETFNRSVVRYIKQWVEDDVGDTTSLEKLVAVDEKGSPDAERFITTTVSSEQVVAAQLVKKAIQFDGTTAPMERSLDELFKRLVLIEQEIATEGLAVRPKAIYVCKTNITSDGEKDDHTAPFELRRAPPILIWRYLVEDKGVDPKDIAIYANLNFAEGTKPNEVNLFSKKDTDFDDFQAGDFRHIIFNLSLQEGWDDPACYLAYIDKSMGSSVQVEQVIGRVLRQYGATHYGNPLLNSAHFFLRVDDQSVFSDSIRSIKAKLSAEGSPIEIVDNFSVAGGGLEEVYPRDDVDVALHQVYVDSESARARIAELTEDFLTFVEGSGDTTAAAHATSHVIDLTDPSADLAAPLWTPEGHTNPVRLRWLINTAVKMRSSRALALLDLQGAKFDVRVQLQSIANKYADKLAADVVTAFYQHAELVYESSIPFKFGVLRVPKKAQSFTNSLYSKYAGLNKFELAFAADLDASGNVWHRNPSAGGYHIPLLSEGESASFYPDFIVWKDDMVFCLDTKGRHLLTDAVARKLFDVSEDGKVKLHVRFITEGKQTTLQGKAIKGGFTVWKMKTGAPTPVHVPDLAKAVAECLK